MVIAERTTSYGVLAALSGVKLVAIAQQGRTDLWAEKFYFITIQKINSKLRLQSNLNSCLGPVMTLSMAKANVT
jgi:hypothetical protein